MGSREQLINGNGVFGEKTVDWSGGRLGEWWSSGWDGVFNVEKKQHVFFFFFVSFLASLQVSLYTTYFCVCESTLMYSCWFLSENIGHITHNLAPVHVLLLPKQNLLPVHPPKKMRHFKASASTLWLIYVDLIQFTKHIQAPNASSPMRLWPAGLPIWL